MSAADLPTLTISRRKWRRLVHELARRGEGRRESGAFLLARTHGTPGKVVEVVPFDDLDPHCLNGSISMRGDAFTKLWAICRDNGLRVVADVHTHPGRGVAQSAVDAANPMVAKRGHVAIILPRFARGRLRPSDAGLHVYNGDRTWESFHDGTAAGWLRLTWL